MHAQLKTFVRLYDEVDKDWTKPQGRRRHWWIGPLNRMLERICQESPGDETPQEIYAKIAVINRVYRTNLHRRTNRVKFPELRIAERFTTGAEAIMRPLRSLRELNRTTMAGVTRCHSELMSLVRKTTQTWEISFCSKYLHFHFPSVVPIYDSYARESAIALVPIVNDGDPQIFEWEYGQYCARVQVLLEEVRRSIRRRPDLRIVDFVLYSLLPDRKLP